MNKENGGVENVGLLTDEFGGATPEVRRKALMPFLWNVMAKNGQLYGNANADSEVKVTNGRNFSYPGYNEIFTGSADPSIDSNDKTRKRQRDRARVAPWTGRFPPADRRVRILGPVSFYPQQCAQQNSRRGRLEAPGRPGPFR